MASSGYNPGVGITSGFLQGLQIAEDLRKTRRDRRQDANLDTVLSQFNGRTDISPEEYYRTLATTPGLPEEYTKIGASGLQALANNQTQRDLQQMRFNENALKSSQNGSALYNQAFGGNPQLRTSPAVPAAGQQITGVPSTTPATTAAPAAPSRVRINRDSQTSVQPVPTTPGSFADTPVGEVQTQQTPELQRALQQGATVPGQTPATAPTPETQSFIDNTQSRVDALRQQRRGVNRPSYTPQQTRDVALLAADSVGFDRSIADAIFSTESGYNANAISGAGARGVGQIVPGRTTVAAELFYPIGNYTHPVYVPKTDSGAPGSRYDAIANDPNYVSFNDLGNAQFDPAVNAAGALAIYAGLLQQYGDLATAAAVYNAGPDVAGKPRAQWPRETQQYVAKIEEAINAATQ